MEYEEDNTEFVAPINPSSLSLDMLTIRLSVERALDLGTGPGFQALRAAQHAGHVVGTDLNHRALNYAAWSAQLNGLDNVEWRYGDLWQPVEGERFGHVLCNPPYIVSPDWEYLYSSSGREGDAISEDVVRGIAAHLEEGGIGQSLCAWIVPDLEDEDWAARPRSWVGGSGCDALIFHFKTDLPLDTASVQRTVLLSHDPAEIAETLDRWTAYYERIGAQAVAYGGIVLRRRSGGPPNWIHAEKLSQLRAGIAGGHVLRLIEAQDLLRSLPVAGGDPRAAARARHAAHARGAARGGRRRLAARRRGALARRGARLLRLDRPADAAAAAAAGRRADGAGRARRGGGRVQHGRAAGAQGGVRPSRRADGDAAVLARLPRARRLNEAVRSQGGGLWTQRPPSIVATTCTSGSSDGSISNGSRSRTTRSAR